MGQMKRLLNKVFKYSGLKSLYFRYARRDSSTIKCPILVYHLISSEAIPPLLFEQHLEFMSSIFNIITLRELYQGIVNHDLPQNPLVISFDDGYQDTYEFALPIFKKYGVAATVFIPTGYIGGWFGRKPIMTVEQIKHLATDGMEIGAHTVSHPNLKRLTREDLRAELAISKTKLEDIIEAAVISLSYPFGLYDSKVEELAQEVGFKIAVTTVHDFFVKPERLFECPRISVYPHDSCKDLQEKLAGDQHWLKVAHKLYLPLLSTRL